MSKFTMKIALNGQVNAQEIDFNKVFTAEFMQKHSKFKTIEEFFNGNKITNQAELERISDQEMNKYVNAKTDFGSWQKMLDAATTEHIKRQFKI